MLWRLGVHAALVGQFLLLASIYLNLCQHKKTHFIWWVALLTIAVSAHFYLFGMVFILFIGFMASRLKKTKWVIVYFLGTLLIIFIAMYLCGYFAVATNSSINQGYGAFHFNPLSLIDPHGWSKILPSIPQFQFNYEGYSYLGLGLIILLIIAAINLIIHRDQINLIKLFKENKNLAIASCLLAFFALTNNINVGNYYFQFALPTYLLDLANIYRVSVRFVWPLLYLTIIFAVYVVIKSYSINNAALILVTCLFIQAFDTSAGWVPLRKKLMSTESAIESPLRNTIWKEFPKYYENVVYMPLKCNQEQRGWAIITSYAAFNHLGTTSTYLARVDCNRVHKANLQFNSLSAQGFYDASTLYIFDQWKYDPNRPELIINSGQDLLAMLDGYIVLAPGWKKIGGLGGSSGIDDYSDDSLDDPVVSITHDRGYPFEILVVATEINKVGN